MPDRSRPGLVSQSVCPVSDFLTQKGRSFARTRIIRSEPMNDNAEAKRLRAEAVIASHPPLRIVIYEI